MAAASPVAAAADLLMPITSSTGWMGVRLRWLIWYFYAAGTTAWCMRRVLASTGVLMGPSTSAYPMEQSSHPALICVSAGTSWPWSQEQGSGPEHHLRYPHSQVVWRENGPSDGRFGVASKGMMVYFMLCQGFLLDRELELYFKML